VSFQLLAAMRFLFLSALFCGVILAHGHGIDDESALADAFGVNSGDGDGDGFVEVADDEDEDHAIYEADGNPSNPQPSSAPLSTAPGGGSSGAGRGGGGSEDEDEDEDDDDEPPPPKKVKKQVPMHRVEKSHADDAVEEDARTEREYDITDVNLAKGKRYTKEELLESHRTPKRSAAAAQRLAKELKLKEHNPETHRDNESVMPLLRHLAMGSQNGAPINIGVCYSIKSCKKITKKCRKHGISQHHARLPGMPHELTPDVCINAELRLASLRFPKDIPKHLVTNLIPLSQLSSDMGTARLENFFSGPVFSDLVTEVDALPAVHAVLTDPRRRMYPNVTSESPLAHVNCNGVAHLFTCRMAVHAALRMVGHDTQYAWVLWERLGQYWRATGYAFFAIQCFRKALECSPHEPNVMYSVACVMHQAGYTEDALALVEPLVSTYPQYVVYQITTCQLLSALAHGEGQHGDGRSLEERMMRAQQSKECYGGLVTRYPGLTGIEMERDKCVDLLWMLHARLRAWELAAYGVVAVALLAFAVHRFCPRLCSCFCCEKKGGKKKGGGNDHKGGKRSGKAKTY